MAVPFMLGNFTTGLFSGAQNIFSLYNEYQGVRRQSALDDYEDQLKKDRKAAADRDAELAKQVKPAAGTQDFSGTPPGPPGGPGAPSQTTLPPTPVSAKPTDSGPTGEEHPALGFDAGIVPNTGRRAPPVPPGATYGDVTPEGLTTGAPVYDVSTGLPRPQPQMSGSPYNAAGVPGQPGSPSGPAVGVMSQPPTQMSGSPYNAAGVPGMAGTPSGPPGVTGSTAFPDRQTAIDQYNQRRAAALAPPPPSVMVDPNAPIPSRQPGAPYTPPPQQGAPFNPGTPTGMYPLQTQGTPPPPEGVGSVNDPIPSRQPGRPIIPPQQGVSPPVPPMPGGPGAPGGRVPLAAGAPSLGGRLMGMLNPIGSAQAAEPTGQGTAIPPPAPVGTTPANAPVPIPPPAQPAQVAPAAPDTAQPQGITPAQPPTGPTPAHPPSGPVVVAGTGGTVEQSQATPPALAPPVDMSHYNDAERNHPERLAAVNRAIARAHAEGVVAPEFMLATIGRENPRWDNSIDHGTGSDGHKSTAKGVVQITDGTRLEIDPQQKLDWRNLDDNLLLGVMLYKHQALEGRGNTGPLGSNTVQNALAYRGGPGAVFEVARLGWDGYAATSEEARSQVADIQKMFPGEKLGNNLVTIGNPGHGPYNARALVAAEQKGGPDGYLDHIQETGPAGLGDSDRWRASQSALEHYLIISGHPEMVPMAAEWVAQVSHQGAVGHLLAADQALLAGDTQGAVNHILRSYAFFPDGGYARAGTDQKGNVWAYRLLDGTTKPAGAPIQITHEVLAQKLIELNHPTTYSKVLQDHQKANAEINLHNAQADWARARPEIETQKAENVGLRTQAAIDKAHADIAMKQQQLQHKAEVDQARNERDKDVSGTVKDYYPPGPPPEGTDAEEYARSGSIFKQLIMTPSEGGAGIAAPAAKYFADGLSAGARPGSPTARQFSLQAVTAKDGTPGYAIKNQKGEVVQSIPHAAGEGLKALIGLAGSEPLRAPGVPAPALTPAPLSPARPTGGAPDMMPSVVNPQNTGIGAGAGTYGALQSGYGQDLTGLPRRRVA